MDAGIRELLHTGSMHNRLRMITGSFLVKNLGIHWTHGEQWFWEHLFDADRDNNCEGWRWVARSRTDAAPYFRIFNPISQGEKFDPKGNRHTSSCPQTDKGAASLSFHTMKCPGFYERLRNKALPQTDCRSCAIKKKGTSSLSLSERHLAIKKGS